MGFPGYEQRPRPAPAPPSFPFPLGAIIVALWLLTAASGALVLAALLAG